MLLSIMTTTSDVVEEAFIRYRGDLYRFVLRRTRNHHEAEELTQQAFVDAVAAVARREAPVSMRAWLYTVAERRITDEARRRTRAATVAERLEAETAAGGVEDTDDVVADALLRLPVPQRQIVVLRIVEERTYPEIASALDCDERACRMRLTRALRRLRH